MVGALLVTQGQAYDNCYLLNLLLDHDFGFYKNLSPTSLVMVPHAMKASSTHDPDSPRLHEAMRSEDRDEFLTAMGKEIAELKSHGTWTIVRKKSMPAGANLLPSTWALKIKCYPEGRKRKSKACFYVRTSCANDESILTILVKVLSSLAHRRIWYYTVGHASKNHSNCLLTVKPNGKHYKPENVGTQRKFCTTHVCYVFLFWHAC
jgi:hypothetical protein